jgi:formate dehydrogenase assembly factor FdhD
MRIIRAEQPGLAFTVLPHTIGFLSQASRTNVSRGNAAKALTKVTMLRQEPDCNGCQPHYLQSSRVPVEIIRKTITCGRLLVASSSPAWPRDIRRAPHEVGS